MIKIPVTEIPALHAQALEQAERNVDRLNDSGVLGEFDRAFNRVIGLKISNRAKMERFLDIAGDMSKAARPYTACKSGCSYCCHIAATITETEAQIIGKAIGRKPKKLTRAVECQETRDKWYRVPCTFLKKGKCSIYEVRPLACRLHVNMADTSFFCNTEVPPGQSLVPQLNLQQINVAHAKMLFGDIWADIRDFFPPRD